MTKKKQKGRERITKKTEKKNHEKCHQKFSSFRKEKYCSSPEHNLQEEKKEEKKRRKKKKYILRVSPQKSQGEQTRLTFSRIKEKEKRVTERKWNYQGLEQLSHPHPPQKKRKKKKKERKKKKRKNFALNSHIPD